MTECLDSSILLAYLQLGEHKELFDQPTCCSAIALFEVERVLIRKAPEKVTEFLSLLATIVVSIPADAPICALAAKLSIKHKLAMADAIMLATARSCNAILYTKDTDFENIKGVAIV